MTKPRARYQGVTERGAAESCITAISPMQSKEKPRRKAQGTSRRNGSRQVRPPRCPFFNTEDNCEQKLCQELLRQAGSCLRIGLLVDGSQVLLQHAE